MGFRTPPNKGIVQYPVVLHVRCDAAMLKAVKGAGGGGFVRDCIRGVIAKGGKPGRKPGGRRVSLDSPPKAE